MFQRRAFIVAKTMLAAGITDFSPTKVQEKNEGKV